MFSKTMVLLAVCLAAPALAQQNASEHPSDANLFLQAVRHSYNGDHDKARKEFAEYEAAHPDDLLVRLRIFDDRLFDVRNANLTKQEQEAFIADVTSAIHLYESEKCAGTDLAGIGQGTLNCDYVGAALYSMRMALHLKYGGKPWVIANHTSLRKDDNQFFFYARRSRSLPADFLLGVHEYELSATFWGRLSGDPRDVHDALRLIGDSTKDIGPFSDDAWFYILRMEIEHKPGEAEMAKQHPAAPIIARLQPKYPRNRIFADDLDFKDSFEP